MTRIRLWLAQQGFDNARLDFGLRTAIAACLAMLVAWSLGLEHPQWAAMTVWATSQPTRGLLIEKSVFRALGTLVGALFGTLLVWVAGDNQLVLVLALASWVGLCTGFGNLLHGLISYGALLAGYSASMVTLLSIASSTDIVSMGIDRLLTVLTGVGVALAVGLLSEQTQDDKHLSSRVRLMAGRLLEAMASRLGEAEHARDAHLLLGEMAAMEEALDPFGAGSLRLRHSARSMRALLSALVDGILWLKKSGPVRTNASLAGELKAASLALETDAPVSEVLVSLRRARELAVDDELLTRTLSDLHTTLQERYHFQSVGVARRAKLQPHLIRHHDWITAGQAMLRTCATLLMVGLAWVWSDWSVGPYVLLGTSVMITLFSSFAHPAWMMRQILPWQLVGVATATGCRWLLWSHATAEWQMLCVLVPFILIGALPFAHRRTMFGAMDYQMSLLLLSQPGLPLSGSLTDSLAIALAVVSAPLLAWLAFTLIFPKDARRSSHTLRVTMIRELQRLAAASGGSPKRHIWRTRLNHRVMKLVRLAEKVGEPIPAATDSCVVVRELGLVIQALQQYRWDPVLAFTARRRVQATLRRIHRELSHSPQQIAKTLSRLARSQRHRDAELSSRLQLAADGLMANHTFFRAAA